MIFHRRWYIMWRHLGNFGARAPVCRHFIGLWCGARQFSCGCQFKSWTFSTIYTHIRVTIEFIYIYVWNEPTEAFCWIGIRYASVYRVGMRFTKRWIFMSCTMCSTLLIRGLRFSFFSALIILPQNVLFGCDDFFLLWFLVLYLHLIVYIFYSVSIT